MTVALLGPTDLPEIATVAEAVRARGGEVAVVDLFEWPSDDPVRFVPGADAATAGLDLDYGDLDAAYVHVHELFRPQNVQFRERADEPAEVHGSLARYREYRSLFESLCRTLDSAGVPVVPSLHAHYLQERKPWQLDRFERAGLPVPDTVFTNDPEVVRAFADRHDRVVYKPVSRGAPPSELDAEDLSADRLDTLGAAPVQFQELVEGEDLRVYVLDGDVVGATRYESGGDSFSFRVDQYEDEDVSLSGATVPSGVADTVRRAADAIDVTFAAADVVCGPDDHALLELNQAPGFAAADELADQGIADALADHLLDA
jgi:glutathione synthase/RimK-type ligase-like ATP-grasp enzyme